MPILSTPETTEVIYGADNVVNKTLEEFSELKICLDGCYDSTAPSMVLSFEPVWKAIKEHARRGTRLRYVTDITGDNISYCKLIVESGCHLRHLNGIKSNFAIADRTEYMATLVIEKDEWQAILSNAKSFVEGQQSIFETLWSKAIPAEQRIREIEEGLKPEFTETISDPSEIQKTGFDLLKSAKEEVSILFSTANGFKRQERAGLMQLLQETDPTVKVRILIPATFAHDNTIKDKFDEGRIIEIRYFLNTSLQTILTSLTVDKKLCLVVELKDDTKDDSYEAIRSATYSNNESIVWTHTSIFETLWMQAELEDRRRIDQNVS